MSYLDKDDDKVLGLRPALKDYSWIRWLRRHRVLIGLALVLLVTVPIIADPGWPAYSFGMIAFLAFIIFYVLAT